MRNPTKVNDIIEGLEVLIDTDKGRIQGIIKKILTTRDNNKGIKVELITGEKGRINKILNENPIKIANKENKVKIDKNFDKPIFIEIQDEIENVDKNHLINIANQRNFEIVTKFFQSTYCKAVKEDIYGIVIFKVKAIEVNMAIYKINMFLKKFCLTKDLKYEVIKVNN